MFLAMPEKDLSAAVDAWDRGAQAARTSDGDKARDEVVRRFPLGGWPTLPLDRYALGTSTSDESYCYWLEYRTDVLGSIRGGSARKHLIFKRRSDGQWSFPTGFATEQDAWNAIRDDYVRAFELAANGSFQDIEAEAALAGGPAIRIKSLYIYFPQAVLPIYSTSDLAHFVRLLGGDPSGKAPLVLNRYLLELARARPEFRDWSNQEIMFFLYGWANPHSTQIIVKIAPGEHARKWQECLTGGYISVGWNEVGDLRQFSEKDDFRKKFVELYSKGPTAVGPTTRKANELWTLMELQPGDIVVANKGTSEIVGIGSIVAPGYQWRPELDEYKHTVSVNWTHTQPYSIDAVSSWATQTVGRVGAELWQRIRLTKEAGQPEEGTDPIYSEIQAGLRARRQIILYGPPGTGKTRAARSFAKWLKGRPLSPNATAAEPIVELVTFHPSYSYEDFIEGYRPVESDKSGLVLKMRDGIFKTFCDRAAKEPGRPYVLIIDEINRGNIPKIFGELITILESDKRGQPITLASGRTMTVPENVYLIGTMNTADRSIRLLDAALRRRFAFVELTPDTGPLDGAKIGPLRLDSFLEELNSRILREAGRERLVGQSYFLQDGVPISDPEEFARGFRQELVPLLDEFCFEDYGKLERLIGGDLVDAEAQQLNADTLHDPDALLAALAKLVPQTTEESRGS